MRSMRRAWWRSATDALLPRPVSDVRHRAENAGSSTVVAPVPNPGYSAANTSRIAARGEVGVDAAYMDVFHVGAAVGRERVKESIGGAIERQRRDAEALAQLGVEGGGRLAPSAVHIQLGVAVEHEDVGARNRYTIQASLPISLPAKRDIDLNSLLNVLLPTASSAQRKHALPTSTKAA